MKIGVLGLQGDFREHAAMLRRLGVEPVDVRTPRELEGTRGLILPGGESTTVRKLLAFSGLDRALCERAAEGYGLYGTCAGMILLARRLVNDDRFEPLGLIDIAVARNAYGRQIDSFETELSVKGLGPFHAVFIRAPQLVETGAGVEVLAEHAGRPVLARQGNVLVSSFHPELTDDPALHRYFLEKVCASAPAPAA